MAWTTASYSYASHADDINIYLSQMREMVGVITESSSNWSETYAGLYNTNYALIIIEHTDGAQLATVIGTGLSPFDGSPYTNFADGNDGDDDRVYFSWNPSASTSSYDTASAPNVTNWCSDAGATKFHNVENVDVRTANRKFNWLVDDTYAKLFVEFQDTVGSPGNAYSVVLFSDSGTGSDGSMYRTGSMRPGDSRGDFIISFDGGSQLADNDAVSAQVADRNGNYVSLTLLADDDEAYGAIDDRDNLATYNPSQPWYLSPMSICIRAQGMKGEISSSNVAWIREGAVTTKKTLNSSGSLHLANGMVIPWDSSWTVT